MKKQQFNFSDEIIQWYALSGRKNLPWQSDNTYHVWISEIMLQQTQVVKVIDYFERFIKKFPNIKTLAQADIEQVLVMWSGLGYYNRARYLHKTANICAEQYDFKLPANLESLMDMPGIGRSTAGAILSLGSNLPYPILDGNVKRVFSRCFTIGKENNGLYEKQLWLKTTNLLPQQHVREYNQALMDIGSTICTRSKPKCENCPLSKICLAKQRDKILFYPPKKLKTKQIKKTYHLLMLLNQNQVYLQQRSDSGIWPQLWFLPMYDNEQNLYEQAKKYTKSNISNFEIEHILTHRKLTLKVTCVIDIKNKNIKGKWVPIHSLTEVSHPTALRKIIEIYEKQNTIISTNIK